VTPTLIACSHGTSDEFGRAAISASLDEVRVLLPGTRVEEAFVDVQEPAIDTVLARWAPAGPVVVVPLLLSTGYHTRVDIARAVAAHPNRATVAPALGPHDLLAEVLESRLAALGGPGPHEAIVLAAAGSTDPAAAVAVRSMADRLAERIQLPIEVGFAAGAGPRISEAVATARARGAKRVVLASYVLAPGYFANVIAASGGDAVTAPLAPDPRVAAIVAERFLAASPLVRPLQLS
jgi:sirohydrochlorin ferrochelatase